MNKTFSTIAISSVIGLASLAQPTHAAVIDQVKSKVDAIKTDTGTLKSRTSAILAKTDDVVQRVEEVGHTVHTLVAETDQVKQALATVQEVKAKFGEIEFDPRELLDDKVQEAVERLREMKEQAAEIPDPNAIEEARERMLSILQDIQVVIPPVPPMGEYVEEVRDPLYFIIEKAPGVVMRIVDKATRNVVEPLQDEARELAIAVQDLREAAKQARSDRQEDRQQNRQERWVKIAGAPLEMCERYSDVRSSEAMYLAALRAKAALSPVTHAFKVMAETAEYLKDESEQTIKIGVHGYFAKEVTITPGDELTFTMKTLVNKLESMSARLDIVMEVGSRYADWDTCNGMD